MCGSSGAGLTAASSGRKGSEFDIGGNAFFKELDLTDSN